MKRYLAHALAAPLFVALVTGCASTPPSIDSNPGAEVTFDGLTQVLNSSADQSGHGN